MSRGLVGDEVEALAGGRPRGFDLGRVADERDRHGLAVRGRLARPAERLGRIVREPIDVADLEPPLGPGLVDLDRDADAFVHRHGQRLRPAHPTQTRGQRDGPAQGPAEVLPGGLREGLVGALQDALGPDVDPRARGHLAVHHQPGLLELAEDLPGRPLADEIRVGDQDSRGPFVGPDDAHRLAALDEQGLVVGQYPQLADDRVERIPAPCRPPGPAVDDEVVGILGDLGIEVVHQHPERGFLRPPTTGQLGAARRTDGSGACTGHARQATPSALRSRAHRSARGRSPGARPRHPGGAGRRGTCARRRRTSR